MNESSSFEWVHPDPKQQMIEQLTASAEQNDKDRELLADKFEKVERLLKRLEFQLASEKDSARSEQLMGRMLKLSAMRERIQQGVQDLTDRIDELLDFTDAMDRESILPPKDE